MAREGLVGGAGAVGTQPPSGVTNCALSGVEVFLSGAEVSTAGGGAGGGDGRGVAAITEALEGARRESSELEALDRALRAEQDV